MVVFEERVIVCLRAVDEQASIETALFLGDPVAAEVPANKYNCRCAAGRCWRFDELHVSIPSVDDKRVLQMPLTRLSLSRFARKCSDDCH
jgi:hypothetical protein